MVKPRPCFHFEAIQKASSPRTIFTRLSEARRVEGVFYAVSLAGEVWPRLAGTGVATKCLRTFSRTVARMRWLPIERAAIQVGTALMTKPEEQRVCNELRAADGPVILFSARGCCPWVRSEGDLSKFWTARTIGTPRSATVQPDAIVAAKEIRAGLFEILVAPGAIRAAAQAEDVR